MADRCANTAATQILSLHEEAVFMKTPRNKSSDCSTEAIRKANSLLFGKIEPDTLVLVLVLVFTTARTGYVAPIKGGEPAGGNKTGGPVGSGDTSLVSTSAWPPQCIGVLIYGLARPMR